MGLDDEGRGTDLADPVAPVNTEPVDLDATAVLLNANARRVSPAMRRKVERIVPPENLYLTRSLAEAEQATRDILARGYRKVVAGGGDGTLALLMDHLCQAAEGTGEGLEPDFPAISVLKLGTGNALASHVGAPSVRKELGRLEGPESPVSGMTEVSVPLHLIESRGRLSFFAGAGIDAMILNDYMAIKRRLRKHFARLGEGIGAYLIAAFGRTVPRLVTTARDRPVARVFNLGRPAIRLNERGLPSDAAPVPSGGLLHEGPLLMASAGTLPYYGGGIVMFPWACDRAGHMQLRLVNPPISHVVRNMGEMWRGSYAHPTLRDFHVTHVRLEFDRPYPVQVAGDAEGWQTELEMRVSPHTVPLVHLT